MAEQESLKKNLKEEHKEVPKEELKKEEDLDQVLSKNDDYKEKEEAQTDKNKVGQEKEEEQVTQEVKELETTTATPEVAETAAAAATTETAPSEREGEQVQSQVPQTNLSGNGRILKEAFPDVEDDIIEAILQSQNGNVDSSFEFLLGMSDPNYKSTPPPAVQEERAPPMPPRPRQNNNNNIDASRDNSTNDNDNAYWQNQAPSRPLTVEEQLRMDEELAKKIAMEDERRLQRRTSQQQRQQQQQQQQQDLRREQTNNSEDDLFANIQEELPIIKEKMKEAGNAAKKKVMDLYNQFKANRNMNNNQPEATSSIPTTNAHYRGLPSDDGDDLLTGDVSALRLSDYDVYAQTGGRTRKSNEFNEKRTSEGVIYVNPPLESTENQPKTSTSDAQLRADEEFARQLAEEERREARQLEQQPPQIPARRSINKPTVVIAPRSPLEMEGDSDYEDVGLTAATSTHSKEKKEDTTVPYVIGDDDDSDSDDLVDVDEEEEDVSNEKKKDDKKLNSVSNEGKTS